MKKNTGFVDRLLRSLLAITAVVLFATGIITGALGVGLMVLSGVFLLTGAVGYCPLYTLLGVNTCARR